VSCVIPRHLRNAHSKIAIRLFYSININAKVLFIELDPACTESLEDFQQTTVYSRQDPHVAKVFTIPGIAFIPRVVTLLASR